jgi:long-chain fatty acid transport protein
MESHARWLLSDGKCRLFQSILTPQAPNGFGFGRIRSNYMLITVPLGFSRQMTERLSAGVSVVPAFSMLQIIPAPFSAPVSGGSTMPYYLSAGNQAPALGAGVNAGLQYAFKAISVGVSYHSPVWFQQFNRKDPSGASHALNFRMNLPQLISMGAGVAVTKSTRIGVDARWYDYANTAGFSKVGYNPDGSVAGFGWHNIWSVGGGVQQIVTKSTRLMAGYN